MSSVFLACLLVAAEPQPVNAVIIAPREFLPALQPLVEHRQQQGHRFAYLSNTGSPADIRAGIRKLAAAGDLKYVVIVGDAKPAARVNAAVAARCVPTHLQPAVVNVKWGSEPQIASDNWYADLDDDQIPDLAIGRIPADTSAELSRIVAKILAYEHNTDFGPWRQRVNFIAGVGGFSPILDTVIETATSKLLTSGIPPAYDTRMTYGSWRSPYCPDPRLFHAMTVERHNEGCLFWVYIGHGQATELDRVSIPGERFHIFNVNDCRELRARGGAPIAIMLACYTAAFDQPQDCLAEALLKADGGPVAVYGGSRVTMPYAMGVMGTAMMSEYFRHRPATLGETILAAKQRMMMPIDDQDHPAGLSRILLDGVAMLMSPDKDQLEAERREHLHVFNLLGDPMLRLAHPQELTLDVPSEGHPGETLRIAGRSTVAGRGTLELVCRRDHNKYEPPTRERFDPTDKALAAFQPVYEQSLDRCWARWALDLPEGDFATQIKLPQQSHGPCHLRLVIANQTKHALGATNLYVRSHPIETASATSKAEHVSER
jgi:peptidase C25-like protein